MRHKELYLEPITLQEGITLEIDPDNPQNLLIKKNEEIIDVFSMARKIYTLFRLLYEFTDTPNYLYDHKEQRVYGTPIPLNGRLFMRMNSIGGYLVVEFIKPMKNSDEEILYLVKATCSTKILWEGISIAFALMKDKGLRTRYPDWFKNMVEVLSLVKL